MFAATESISAFNLAIVGTATNTTVWITPSAAANLTNGQTTTYSITCIAYSGVTYAGWPYTEYFTDSFTYTVADGRGGTATGMITVNVAQY
jgi:hypothetical protein